MRKVSSILRHVSTIDLLTPIGRSERSLHSQNIIPVLLAFKKQGGLELLNSKLIEFKNEICKKHETDDEVVSSRLASLSLKKILDIYAMLANEKLINEAVSAVNVLPQRATSGDRRGDNTVTSNLIVELRAIMLPVIQALWESPLIEKGSATAVAKIIEILKFISLAELENHAYRRSDKVGNWRWLSPINRTPWLTCIRIYHLHTSSQTMQNLHGRLMPKN